MLILDLQIPSDTNFYCGSRGKVFTFFQCFLGHFFVKRKALREDAQSKTLLFSLFFCDGGRGDIPFSLFRFPSFCSFSSVRVSSLFCVLLNQIIFHIIYFRSILLTLVEIHHRSTNFISSFDFRILVLYIILPRLSWYGF